MTGNNVVKQEASEDVINSRHQTLKAVPAAAIDTPPSFEDVYQAIMLQKVSPVFELRTCDTRWGEVA